jgi:hypothetical protein
MKTENESEADQLRAELDAANVEIAELKAGTKQGAPNKLGDAPEALPTTRVSKELGDQVRAAAVYLGVAKSEAVRQLLDAGLAVIGPDASWTP